MQNEEVDLEEEDDGDNDMDADDDEDYEADGSSRRRSRRLSAKQQVHYFNDGDAIVRLRRNSKSNTPRDDELQRDKSATLPLSLRRPKRQRKKPRNAYEESQWEEYYKTEERRASLREKKAVNYAESADSDEEESSAGGTTVTTSPRSRSRSTTRSTRSRSRSVRSYRRRRGRSNHNRRHREWDSSTEDSGSSSCSTDTYMDIRRERRLRKERKKIKPIEIHDLGLYDQSMAPAFQKKKSKEGPADISPMDIDLKVDWSVVGGLQHHVQKLKEMVVLPLLYPKEFAQFKMATPKGVLFHGPPGTGKTLVARVLAAQCSMGTNPDGTPKKKVAFYMRKGADCLSKWVGEAGDVMM